MAIKYCLPCAVVIVIACWQKCLAGDTLSKDDVLVRFEALEKQGQEQQSELDELRSVVETQNHKINQQELLIEQLLEWKQEHEARETVPRAESDGSAFPEQDTAGDTRVHTKQSHSRQKDLSRPSRILIDRGSPIAFHAVITNNTAVENLGINQNVVFGVVKLNLGGGYHSQHGIFIAPTPGVYLFSLSALAFSHGKTADYSLDVFIVKNGEQLAGAYGHGDSLPWDQGSVTVVTQLAAADEVWVDHRYGSKQAIYGNYFSSFMGSLLYLMD